MNKRGRSSSSSFSSLVIIFLLLPTSIPFIAFYAPTGLFQVPFVSANDVATNSTTLATASFVAGTSSTNSSTVTFSNSTELADSTGEITSTIILITSTTTTASTNSTTPSIAVSSNSTQSTTVSGNSIANFTSVASTISPLSNLTSTAIFSTSISSASITSTTTTSTSPTSTSPTTTTTSNSTTMTSTAATSSTAQISATTSTNSTTTSAITSMTITTSSATTSTTASASHVQASFRVDRWDWSTWNVMNGLALWITNTGTEPLSISSLSVTIGNSTAGTFRYPGSSHECSFDPIPSGGQCLFMPTPSINMTKGSSYAVVIMSPDGAQISFTAIYGSRSDNPSQFTVDDVKWSSGCCEYTLTMQVTNTGGTSLDINHMAASVTLNAKSFTTPITCSSIAPNGQCELTFHIYTLTSYVIVITDPRNGDQLYLITPG